MCAQERAPAHTGQGVTIAEPAGEETADWEARWGFKHLGRRLLAGLHGSGLGSSQLGPNGLPVGAKLLAGNSAAGFAFHNDRQLGTWNAAILARRKLGQVHSSDAASAREVRHPTARELFGEGLEVHAVMQVAQSGVEHTAQRVVMQAAYSAEMEETQENPDLRPYRLNRRANLLRLIEQAGGPTEVAAALGTPKTHISAMTREGTNARNVGDDLATRAEQVYGLPHGWMDEAHDVEPSPAVQRTSITDALGVIGSALAQDVPEDVRQDAAYLLNKLAMRQASERNRTDLVRLLEPFAAGVKLFPLERKESGSSDRNDSGAPPLLGGDIDHPNKEESWAPETRRKMLPLSGPATPQPRPQKRQKGRA